MGKLNENLKSLYQSADAADEYAPLPAGSYEAEVFSGAMSESRNGVPSYKVTFEIADGEFTGRRVWHDIYLSAKAMPYAVRDLTKLFGQKPSSDDLEKPIPFDIRCRIKLALRTSDSGEQFNRVSNFEVLSRSAVATPFAPKDDAPKEGAA